MFWCQKQQSTFVVSHKSGRWCCRGACSFEFTLHWKLKCHNNIVHSSVCVNAFFILSVSDSWFFGDIDQECRWQWNGLTINKPLCTSARILGITGTFSSALVWYRDTHGLTLALLFCFFGSFRWFELCFKREDHFGLFLNCRSKCRI